MRLKAWELVSCSLKNWNLQDEIVVALLDNSVKWKQDKELQENEVNLIVKSTQTTQAVEHAGGVVGTLNVWEGPVR